MAVPAFVARGSRRRRLSPSTANFGVSLSKLRQDQSERCTNSAIRDARGPQDLTYYKGRKTSACINIPAVLPSFDLE